MALSHRSIVIMRCGVRDPSRGSAVRLGAVVVCITKLPLYSLCPVQRFDGDGVVVDERSRQCGKVVGKVVVGGAGQQAGNEDHGLAGRCWDDLPTYYEDKDEVEKLRPFVGELAK